MPKYHLTSNEKINLSVILSIVLIAESAILTLMFGKTLTESVVGALAALPGNAISGFVGFLARDAMGKMPHPPEPQEDLEEPKE